MPKSLASIIDSKKAEATTLDDLLKQNDRSRERIAASGEDDPTGKKGPSALERIFGPLDALGTGVRGLVYNAVSDKDVNVWDEMGKSLRGERRIEGADILGELGVDNKWAKFIGGLALDVALDPLTYISFGYSAAAKQAGKTAITTAAKSGGLLADDIARFAGRNADEIASAAAKALGSKGDDLAALTSRILSGEVKVPLGILDDATANAVKHGILAKAAAELGQGGGVKMFGQTVLPMQGVLDKTTDALRAKALANPVGDWLGKAFVAYGDKIPTDANDLMRIAIPRMEKQSAGIVARGRAIGERINKLVAKALPDEAQRDVFTLAIGREFGDMATRQNLDELYKAVKASKDKLYDGVIAAARKSGMKVSDKPTKATITKLLDQLPEGVVGRLQAPVDAAEDALRQAVSKAWNDNGLAAVERTFREAGYGDDVIAKVNEVLPKYHDLMDEMARLRADAGLDAWTLYGDVLPKSAPGSAGYVTGRNVRQQRNVLGLPTRETKKTLDAQDEAFGRIGLEIGEQQDELAPLSARNLLESGSDVKPMSSPRMQLTPKKYAHRKYMDEERRMVEGGLLTELDAAKLAEAKVVSDYTDIAAQKLSDSLTATGLPEEQVAQLKRAFLGVMNDDEAVRGFWRTFDKVQNAWKRGATAMRLGAFQNRNMFSNKILQAMKGVLDPESEMRGVALMKRIATGQIKEGTSEYDEVLDLIERGVIQTAEQFAEQVKGGKFGPITRIGGTWNEIVENQARISAYFSGLKQGLDPESAARLVDEALYDYSNIARTAFEQAVMMRAVPFYKWIRQNLPNMATTLVKDPGKVAWLGHLKESGEAISERDKSVEPDWLRDLFPIPTPLTDKRGNEVMISTAGLFPQGELEILSGLLRGEFEPKDAFGSLSPILRTPMELLFGKDLWYDTPISKYEGEKKRVPAFVEKAADAMRDVPGLGDVWKFISSRIGIEERQMDDGLYWVAPAESVKLLRDLTPWLNNVSKMLEDQEKTPYDRFGGITGIKPVLYEQDRFAMQQQYQDRSDLQDIISRLRDEGRLAPPANERTTSISSLFGGR